MVSPSLVMVALVLLAKAVVGLDVFSKLLTFWLKYSMIRMAGAHQMTTLVTQFRLMPLHQKKEEEVVQVLPVNRGRGNAFQKHNYNIF